MSRKSRVVKWYPGNTIMSQIAFDEHVMSVGRGWLDLIRALRRSAEGGVLVERISVRGVGTGSGDLLIVLSGRSEEGFVVAFHNADDESVMWLGLANRMKSGRLKWRHDEYRNET